MRLATLLQRVATCCELIIELVRMPWHNIAVRTWLNDYNIMQHLQMLRQDLTIFKFEPTTPNMSQHIATWWPNVRNMLRPTMLGYVALKCCDCLAGAKFFMQHLWMLHGVVVVWPGSCNNVAPRHAYKFDFQLATCRNTFQQGGQTRAACCAQQCCDLLRSNVAIVWPGLANTGPTMLRYVALRCCDRFSVNYISGTSPTLIFINNSYKKNWHFSFYFKVAVLHWV